MDFTASTNFINSNSAIENILANKILDEPILGNDFSCFNKEFFISLFMMLGISFSF